MVALMVVMIVLAFLTVDYLVQRRALAHAAEAAARRPALGLAPVPVSAPPGNVFLTPGHTWLQLASDGTVAVGADALPATLLGRPAALELLEPGRRVARGEVMAVLARDGRRIPLRAPVEGVVAQVNDALRETPDALAESPYEGGWLYRLRPAGLGSTLAAARVAEEAADWLQTELTRARDAVVRLARPEPVAVGATMLDGGPLAGPPAAYLDEGAWDELVQAMFQAGAAHPHE